MPLRQGPFSCRGTRCRHDNSETVPFGAALDVVRELIDHNRWPATVAWQGDRG
ncbi:hypothetical protein [Actinoplanes regularis]|uniref:hypothetical protein n=1 Tax=Actinoplanes regularis TaxID=52697 RepID=UPI0015C61765|nr:hypothetical protein [Actinoplanes regularis]